MAAVNNERQGACCDKFMYVIYICIAIYICYIYIYIALHTCYMYIDIYMALHLCYMYNVYIHIYSSSYMLDHAVFALECWNIDQPRHREIFSKFYQIKSKSDSNYHFPIDLDPNGRPYRSKSIIK